MQVQNQSGNGNEEINYNDFVPKHPKRNKMYKKFHLINHSIYYILTN
jgi:hypothetical protein